MAKRILVADDDADLRDLLGVSLRQQGYEVVLAEDGKEALQLALVETLDLCLFDVMMPYIDGYHVADEVTRRLGSKAPKILIMTSRDTEREKGVTLMSGAVGAIQKPFPMEELRKTVAAMLAQP